MSGRTPIGEQVRAAFSLSLAGRRQSRASLKERAHRQDAPSCAGVVQMRETKQFDSVRR